MIVPPAEASFAPSGEYATASTWCLWPFSAGEPPGGHVPQAEGTVFAPSGQASVGEKASPYTFPLCSESERSFSPVAASHSRTTRAWVVANSLPSGENATSGMKVSSAEKVRTSCPDATSQRRKTLYPSAETSRVPSGDRAMP